MVSRIREVCIIFDWQPQFEVQDYSVETVLSDDVDIEALNEGFPMSNVIQIQVENAIYDYD